MSGLPELPENQRWNVIRRGSEFLVLLETRVTKECEVSYWAKGPTQWFKRNTTIPETWVTAAYGAAGVDAPLTPDKIREATWVILSNRARQAETETLLGAYPPKTLP